MTRVVTDETKPAATISGENLAGWRWWAACGVVFALALAASAPTVGDFGLTWDEPAYRFSQLRSAQWWERLSESRSISEAESLVEPDALLFYWTYGRHGINFHPPLAGQLNLLTYKLFGRWLKDIPARRMASVLEFALTITLGFGFLARRYGPWVGGVMAASLLLMPRVYGDAHIAGTDTPGLLLWPATALAFWKGLNEPKSRVWRVLVGVLLGLAFVEKMGAVVVLAPLLAWLILARLPQTFFRTGGRADWIDGVITSAAMIAPLVVALAEIFRIARLLPPPGRTDLFVDRPPSQLPGAILALPLVVWMIRRLLARTFPKSVVWGTERPALEIWTAILAFAPVVGWLGNPAWWRETLTRLTHYYMLNTDRRGSLPDIRILYDGRIYEFSLPWHNGWVLLGITVPVAILTASLLGLIYAFRNMRRDLIPLYFVVHLAALPVMRMFPTPAHDGVRLFLPTFFFLAAMAGWGAVWLADGFSRLARAKSLLPLRIVVAALVLAPSAWQLVKIHPYELSYYNELIGGPRNAWRAGFELTYWYDAFNPPTIDAVNAKLPPNARVDLMNEKTNPMTFGELQALGGLRADIVFGASEIDTFPYVFQLALDSKSSPFTRLLHAMTPWYASRPPQLDGAPVFIVADPLAVSRAWGVWLLTEAVEPRKPAPARAPAWVKRYAPFLRRFWGEQLVESRRTLAFEPLFEWAKTDPDGLLGAAIAIAEHRDSEDNANGRRLTTLIERNRPVKGDSYAQILLRARPEGLVEAVKIVIAHPDEVRRVLARPGYTDTETIGGALDRDLPR